MEIRETVKLKDGREVKLVLSENEHNHILSVGIDYLLHRGWMVLASDTDMLGTKGAIKEINDAQTEANTKVKQ